MGKQSGLGDNLYVSGYDVSGDIQSLGGVHGGPATLPTTGIDKGANERIGGVRDGGITATAYFNPGTGRAHPVLSTLPQGDRIVTYCRGTALGSPAASCVAKQLNYDGTRADDGGFTFAVEAQASRFGLEWGVQATPGITQHTAATDGPSIDLGTGPTAFGLQAYLHVMAFTGTSATVTIQESSDDGVADPWADVAGGVFTAVTAAPATERIATASGQSVGRYLRVSTAGTFTVLQFAVVVVRNQVEVTF